MQLRDYQLEIIRQVHDRDIVCLPTGTGKSAVIATLTNIFHSGRKRVAIVVPTVELKRQLSHSLELWGAKNKATVSVWKSAKSLTADVWLHDECHHSASTTWKSLFDKPGTHIGFTATPVRFDGLPLDGFKRVLEPHLMDWYINNGYLSNPTEYSVDLGLDTWNWADDELPTQFLRLDKRKIYGEVLANYNQHANKQTKSIVYCTTIEHAQIVSEHFNSIGVASKPIHSKMTHAERADILKQFREGALSQLTNVQLLTEGVDVPSVDMVIMLRATGSVALYYQMVGRAIRPKSKSYILDFVANIPRFGSVRYNDGWTHHFHDAFTTLELSKNVVICSKCACVLAYSSQVCPECGHEKSTITQVGKLPRELHGSLQEYTISAFEQALIRARKCPDAKKGVGILKRAAKHIRKGDEAKLAQFLDSRFSSGMATLYHRSIMELSPKLK